MAVEKRNEVAFNIGVIQSYFVAELYKEVLKNFYNGDFKRCYDILYGGLRNVIESDLKETERTDLDKVEVKVEQKYQNLMSCRKKTDFIKAKKEYLLSVNEYLRKILAHLRVLGYLPSKKQREMLF